jgi:hypothetical protein
MKKRFTLAIFTLLVICPAAFAQTTVKLFDAVPVDYADTYLTYDTAQDFGTAEIYLSCPERSTMTAVLSGPNSGKLIVDNYLTVNGANVCPNGGSCFIGVLADPIDFLGEPMEVPYLGIDPIDISSMLTGSGLYTFKLKDYGYTFGATEVYLTTSCSSVNQVCHRNNGNNGNQKTLTVGGSAVAAHLAHGDTAGPCS